MYKDLSLLLDLQEIDKALILISEKCAKIENSIRAKECENLLAMIQKEINELNLEIDERKKEIRNIERDTIHHQDTIKELDDEIYSGENNSKELHYLLYEKDKNKKSIDDFENSLMVLLEENESSINRVQELKAKEFKLDSDYQEINSIEGKAKEELRYEKEVLLDSREHLISKISERILINYEDRKERLNYKFVCEVDDSAICGGCFVKLPMIVFKNITNKKVARCDECGRYLVYKQLTETP